MKKIIKKILKLLDKIPVNFTDGTAGNFEKSRRMLGKCAKKLTTN